MHTSILKRKKNSQGTLYIKKATWNQGSMEGTARDTDSLILVLRRQPQLCAAFQVHRLSHTAYKCSAGETCFSPAHLSRTQTMWVLFPKGHDYIPKTNTLPNSGSWDREAGQLCWWRKWQVPWVCWPRWPVWVFWRRIRKPLPRDRQHLLVMGCHIRMPGTVCGIILVKAKSKLGGQSGLETPSARGLTGPLTRSLGVCTWHSMRSSCRTSTLHLKHWWVSVLGSFYFLWLISVE